MKPFLVLLGICAALPVAAQDAQKGQDIFGQYCAACHGAEAHGDGPMSGVLSIPPTNLTALAGEHDGEFPINSVIAKIDGRDPLLAHGSEMPVYGQFFEGKGIVLRDETGAPVMTSQPIIDLVLWLQSIQE
jgi:mono/diheme cytochrome c family protein